MAEGREIVSPYDAIEEYAKKTQKGIEIVKDDFDRAFDVIIGANRARSGMEYQ
jgi:hypothetical protein